MKLRRRAKHKLRGVTPFAEEWIASRERRISDQCHGKQREFVFDPSMLITGLVGRGGGKTTAVAFRAIICMMRLVRANCVYVTTTRDNAETLMWDPIRDLLTELDIPFEENSSKLEITLIQNGSRLRLYGCDKEDQVKKLRGRKFDFFALDEVASFQSRLVHNVLYRGVMPRLGERDGKGIIILIGTPSHELQGHFYDATRPGNNDPETAGTHRPYGDRELPVYAGWKGWSSHHWTLEDAATEVEAMRFLWLGALERKRLQKWSDNNYEWLTETMAIWASESTGHAFTGGVENNLWEPELDAMGFAKLPGEYKDYLFVYGVDLGSKDPTAIVVFAFKPSDPTRTLWQVYEFQQIGMHTGQLAAKLVGPRDEGHNVNNISPNSLMGVTGWPAAIVVDALGGGGLIIKDLSVTYGIPVKEAANKDNFKFKLPAYALVNGDLADKRFRIIKGGDLHKQMIALQLVPDEYGNLHDNKSQANHLTDCVLYARTAINYFFNDVATAAAVDPAAAAAAPPPFKLPKPAADFGTPALAPGRFDGGGNF